MFSLKKFFELKGERWLYVKWCLKQWRRNKFIQGNTNA